MSCSDLWWRVSSVESIIGIKVAKKRRIKTWERKSESNKRCTRISKKENEESKKSEEWTYKNYKNLTEKEQPRRNWFTDPEVWWQNEKDQMSLHRATNVEKTVDLRGYNYAWSCVLNEKKGRVWDKSSPVSQTTRKQMMIQEMTRWRIEHAHKPEEMMKAIYIQN